MWMKVLTGLEMKTELPSQENWTDPDSTRSKYIETSDTVLWQNRPKIAVNGHHLLDNSPRLLF